MKLYSKKSIKKKVFKSLGLDYNYFVDPNEEFNTTDLYHSKVPGCRLIVGLVDDAKSIVFYECGSYYGTLVYCRVGIKSTGQVYQLNEKLDNRVDLLSVIQTKPLKLIPISVK